MEIKWKKSRVKDIVVNCPICKHQTVPPIYPYCSHTVFVYLVPYFDDSSFVYQRNDYLTEWSGTRFKKPNRKNLSSMNFIESCEVLEMSESSGYYPSKVIVGHEIRK